LTALFSNAEEAARATEPPSILMKFLAPVATAISDLSTAA
jgi:hypothetical protein